MHLFSETCCHTSFLSCSNNFDFDIFSLSFLFVGAVTFTTTSVTAREWTRQVDLILEDRLESQIHFVLRQNEQAGFPVSSKPLRI